MIIVGGGQVAGLAQQLVLYHLHNDGKDDE